MAQRFFSIIGICFCIAVMIGFYFLIQFMITGVNEQFGHGVAVGMLLLYIIVFAAWKFDPDSFNAQRRDR